MSYLQPYHNTLDDGKVSISEEQGSSFAKQLAGDFNPIHDLGSKRFCVPGDLLFALTLDHVGLHAEMAFTFLGLVCGGAALKFPRELSNDTGHVLNERERPVLGFDVYGGTTRDVSRIEQLVLNYVAFSGQNFPHILLPLLEKKNVMVNPERPLVIYESMSFKLNNINFDSLALELNDTTLEVNGKRGRATLHFTFFDGNRKIGSGLKTLLLTGLREYQEQEVNKLITEYQANKDAGLAKLAGSEFN